MVTRSQNKGGEKNETSTDEPKDNIRPPSLLALLNGGKNKNAKGKVLRLPLSRLKMNSICSPQDPEQPLESGGTYSIEDDEHIVIVSSLQQRLEACFPGPNNGQTSEANTHICTRIGKTRKRTNKSLLRDSPYSYVGKLEDQCRNQMSDVQIIRIKMSKKAGTPKLSGD